MEGTFINQSLILTGSVTGHMVEGLLHHVVEEMREVIVKGLLHLQPAIIETAQLPQTNSHCPKEDLMKSLSAKYS